MLLNRQAAGSRVLYAVLVTALLFSGAPSALFAGAEPDLSGTVFDHTGGRPRAGIVVALVDPANEIRFASEPTGADGRFVVNGAPAGRYAVLAEADEGAYLAASDLRWNADADTEILVSLAPAVQDDDEGDATPPSQSQSAGMPTWGKAVLAGVLTITGVVLIEEVSEDTDEAASPSTR